MTPHDSYTDDLPADASPSVLLVDDDEVNLLVTGQALRECGFVVHEARGGAQALARLADVPADVVVLDAMMPGLDGFETCAMLRATPGLEHIPVLMLTGLDDDASIRRAYEAGATDFFVKSPQWSLLEGRLRYLLRAARIREELARSRSRLARAQDLARMGSLEWYPQAGSALGRLELSPEATRLFGLPQPTPSVRAILRRVVSSERHALIRAMGDLAARGTVLATDLTLNLADGRCRIVHLELEPAVGMHGSTCAGVVQDVTDRRLAEDRIRHLANFDSLTGLPNRRQLIWRTERAVEHARRLGHLCALLLIDLDRFKVINDTLGHAAGDELLIEVARRLRGCVRHSDQVLEAPIETAGVRVHRTLEAVGRLGGDEFVALLPEIAQAADAQRVAERILQALRAPIFAAGQECFVTASVGVALFPRDGDSVIDLLRNSDVAMYAAKSAGRNAATVFVPSLLIRGRDRLELDSALHKALERQEIELHYQPKVDVAHARVVGAEALMRWNHNGRVRQPGDFIPLAEESGLIEPLSYWALDEAARQVALWRAGFGFSGTIAVNLPARVLDRSELVDRIQECVQRHAVGFEALIIEITETGLMRDMDRVLAVLERLRAIGVRLSIDDFGTGYSSLAYLTALPISELKIDGSFVRGLGVAPRSAAVATAIVALGRSLGLEVVAEGVETLGQLRQLRAQGCEIMQGYLFSPALVPAAFEHWIGRGPGAAEAPWVHKVAA